jgi:outer membrane protein, heavy metal efflux system
MNCMPGPDPMRSESCAQYGIEQEFPLWGKRGLAREIARAHAAQAGADRDRVRLEVLASVREAFAEYYAAHQSAALTEQIRQTVLLAANVAQSRYEQALGSQQDAIMLRVEIAELDAGLARKRADERRAGSRLNALLNRPLDAPLASPEALPAIPDSSALNLNALMERARSANPALKAQDAAIAAASGTKALADKSWYPDVTVGVSAMAQSQRSQAYAGMLSVKLPFNTAQRRADQSAAISELGAAKTRRDAAEAEIRGNLERSYLDLQEGEQIAAILHESHIPQAELALRSALSAYGESRAPSSAVLEAERHTLQNQIEHLSAQLQQQKAVADIERLIGGEL